MSLGLLWTEETENQDTSFFNNYRTALNNYFEISIQEVDTINHVSQLKNLIIVDEHYKPHNRLICNPRFIQMINRYKVNVVIFNTEKIFNSYWMHNLETQRTLEKLNNFVQILSDVKDIKKIGTPFKNKQYLSKEFKFKESKIEKINRILFFGQLDGSAYKNRRKILEKVSQSSNIPLDIFKSTRSISYEKYIDLLSSYKFVLNPFGAGEFINIRYFESLEVGTIPVQQVTRNINKYYSYEFGKKVSINFTKPNMLRTVDFESIEYKPFNYYLEDYFYHSNLKSIFK